MADSDQSLKILLELGVIGEKDVQATKELLSETAKASQAASESAGKLGEDTKEAADKIKLFHGEGQEMKRVLTELTNMSPVLGMALKTAMSPVAGTIGAAISLFVLMKNQIAETNRQLDEMGDQAADPTFLNGIQAKLDILHEANKAAADYTKQINTLLTGEKGLTAELTSQLALQAAINGSKGEQAKAEQTLAEAKIRAAAARGQITPEQAEAQIAATKIKAAEAEARRKQDEAVQTVVTKSNALESAEGQQAQLKANADALTQTYEQEKARRTQLVKDFGADGKYGNAQKLAGAELEAAQEELRIAKRNSFGVRGDKGSSSDQEWSAAELKIAQAEAKLNSLREANRRIIENEGKNAPQFDELGRQAADARKSAEDNATLIGSLKTELTRLTDSILATRGPENATLQANRSTILENYRGDLGKQNAEVFQRDARAIQTGNPAEIDAAVKEAQAHARALVAAANAAHGANKEVYAATLEALKAVQWEQSQMAAQIRALSRRH